MHRDVFFFFPPDRVFTLECSYITLVKIFHSRNTVIWHATCVWKFLSFYIMTHLLPNLLHSVHVLFLWSFFSVGLFLFFFVEGGGGGRVLKSIFWTSLCLLSHDFSLFF